MGLFQSKPLGNIYYGCAKSQTVYIGSNPQELIYVGYFKNGQKHGRGVLYNDRVAINGIWEDNMLRGYGILVCESFKYVGIMKTESYNGNEVLLFSGFGSTSNEFYQKSIQKLCNRHCIGLYDNSKLIFGCDYLENKGIRALKFGMHNLDECDGFKGVSYEEKEEGKGTIKCNIEKICTSEITIEKLCNSLMINPISSIFLENVKDSLSDQIYAIDDIAFENKLQLNSIELSLEKLIRKTLNGGYYFEGTYNSNKVFVKAHLMQSNTEKQLYYWNEYAHSHISIKDLLVQHIPLADHVASLLFENGKQYKISLVQNAQSDAKFYIELSNLLEEQFFLDRLWNSSNLSSNIVVNVISCLFYFANALEEENIYHGSIRPNKIWYNYSTGEIKIVGLSHSTIFADGMKLNCHTYSHDNKTSSLTTGKDYAYLFDYDFISHHKRYKYLPFEEKYNRFNYKQDNTIEYSLYRRDSVAIAFIGIKSIIKLLKLKTTDSSLKEINNLWRKVLLLKEYNNLVNSLPKIKSIQLLYMIRLVFTITHNSTFLSLPGKEQLFPLILICYSIIVNSDIETLTQTKSWLESLRAGQTEIVGKQIEEKKLAGQSFSNFKQIAQYLKINNFDNIYFQGHSKEITTSNLASSIDEEEKLVKPNKELI